jgi:hypothetical protein
MAASYSHDNKESFSSLSKAILDLSAKHDRLRSVGYKDELVLRIVREGLDRLSTQITRELRTKANEVGG